MLAIHRRWGAAVGWLLALSLVPAALLVTWYGLVAVDFGYSAWYPALGIKAHIAEFAPQNRHGRADFAQTDAAEHKRLLGELVRAIHREGEGLAAITYRDEAGRPLGSLLRGPESRTRRPLGPGTVAIDGGLGGLVLAGGVTVLLLGPLTAFRTLHEWAFGEGAPWFFYYQDSLLTTLTKAPDLFFAVGGLWLLTAGVVLAMLDALLRWLVGGHRQKASRDRKL